MSPQAGEMLFQNRPFKCPSPALSQGRQTDSSRANARTRRASINFSSSAGYC